MNAAIYVRYVCLSSELFVCRAVGHELTVIETKGGIFMGLLLSITISSTQAL